MRYLVLACDFDETLAHDGTVDEAVLTALDRFRASGRRLILVTGRELADLIQTCPSLEQFDYVVAENGATLYHPATRKEKPLADPPPAEFVDALRVAGVHPLSVGRVIVATSLDDRPLYFAGLLTRLEELRTRSGHPHWIVIDEAHHVLPSTWERSALSLPQHLDRMLFITLEEADLVAATALAAVDTLIVLGSEPAKTFDRFGRAANLPMPPSPAAELETGEAVFWSKETATARVMRIVPGTTQRRRHSRKYAEGDLGLDRSFYFRGPEGKLNLRAQNLIVFLQMAEGVDDETWQFHLQRREYSQWFREMIKDPTLADDAAAIERQTSASAAESRAAIKALIEKHYTLPGGPATPVTETPEGKKT